MDREVRENFAELFDLLEDMEDAGMIEKFNISEEETEWKILTRGEFSKEKGNTITITLFVRED